VTSRSLVSSVFLWRLKVSYSNFLTFRALSGSFRPLQRPSERRSPTVGGSGRSRVFNERPTDVIENDYI
jgi:hypothetical protein